MDQQSLNDLLRTLHHELEHGPDVDAASREMLLKVLEDIQGVLAQSKVEPSPEHASLGGRLRDATWQMEETHPKLTSAAEELVRALSRIFQ